MVGGLERGPTLGPQGWRASRRTRPLEGVAVHAVVGALIASALMGVMAHLTIVWLESTTPGTGLLLRTGRVLTAIVSGVTTLVAAAHLLRIPELSDAINKILLRFVPR